jgi:transcriptional regulator with XRE-family HTH domain
MSPSRSSVHFQLLEARWSAGLTQEELAMKCGISVRTVGDIERGRVSCPRAATLRLLAGALGLGASQTSELLLRTRVEAAGLFPPDVPEP